MGTAPNPLNASPDAAVGPSPFVATTTPNIERANRLISLRAHPGFLDLLRLSQDLVQGAVDATTDYPGWDPQVITVLKVRQQTAKEHHHLLLAQIQDTIQLGIQEAKDLVAAQVLAEKSPADVIDQGDFVRQQVLQTFDAIDNRAAGSY